MTYKIYENQKKCGQIIASEFYKNGCDVVNLMAEFQSGKTGTVIAACEDMTKLLLGPLKEDLERDPNIDIASRQIVFFFLMSKARNTMLSNLVVDINNWYNNLSEEMKNIIYNKGFDPKHEPYVITHLSKWANITKNLEILRKECDAHVEAGRRIVICVDEGHLAIGENGKVDQYLSQFSFIKDELSFKNAKTHLIWFGATNYSQYLAGGKKKKSGKFKNVYLTNGENYCSIRHLYKQDRFIETGRLSLKTDIDRIKFVKLIKKCNYIGKFLFLRTCSRGKYSFSIETLKRLNLEKYLNIEIEYCQILGSFLEEQTNKLIGSIAEPRKPNKDKLTIILINSAFSAGERIPTCYIAGWFECFSPEKGKNDTIMQRCGRMCGYSGGKLGINSDLKSIYQNKIDDEFPIFVSSLKPIKDYIDYIDNQILPKNSSSRIRDNKSIKYKWEMMSWNQSNMISGVRLYLNKTIKKERREELWRFLESEDIGFEKGEIISNKYPVGWHGTTTSSRQGRAVRSIVIGLGNKISKDINYEDLDRLKTIFLKKGIECELDLFDYPILLVITPFATAEQEPKKNSMFNKIV